MASIVPNPLNRFRKHDSHEPLHARWGDVSITAPTEGSWCQYDNPHQSRHRRLGYGPGYVPDGLRRAPILPAQHYEDDEEDEGASRAEHNTSSRRMSTLNPRRLSMRLSRTKSQDGQQKQQQQQQQRPPGIDRTEFAYKPIKQNYSTEVAETAHKRESRFRYIPASPQYLEEPERSQSVSSGSGSGSGSASSSSSNSYGYGYSHLSRSGSPLRNGVGVDDEFEIHRGQRDRGSRAFPMGSSTISGQGQHGYGQNNGLSVSGDRKRRYSTRRLTTVMVPDPEDMYG
ncbi:uncharacterized protein EURHEDRAFT_407723 [Aspergillus ruber CBS 135680]|uniref:Uncharacterized protein n=1 Tax=Aspergillus ruber (strain CBS 135680) TaxID=1388766 RepID=A0A017SRX7_ASPRC|nr:uncharacterized protein EURHEDRAFT_407723 [Aspergillus ruber CBS 135680]EYE99728.1 hypothetical protein EURHEDRAFT_407723 [Aspergillus ruber CBS 135680]